MSTPSNKSQWALWMAVAVLFLHQIVLQLKLESIDLVLSQQQQQQQQLLSLTNDDQQRPQMKTKSNPPTHSMLPDSTYNENVYKPVVTAKANSYCALKDMSRGIWNGQWFIPDCVFTKPSYGSLINKSIVFVGDSNLDAMHSAFRSLVESPAHMQSMIQDAPNISRGPVAHCKVTTRGQGRCTPVSY